MRVACETNIGRKDPHDSDVDLMVEQDMTITSLKESPVLLSLQKEQYRMQITEMIDKFSVNLKEINQKLNE